MATYHELQDQIRTLQAQAEALKAEELPLIIADIKKKIEEYGIKADQIFGESELPIRNSQNKASLSTKTPLAMKYECEGVQWSGRGKRPKIFTEAIEKAAANGITLTMDDFLIKNSA